MFEKLKTYCNAHVPFTDAELDLIDEYFEIVILKNKESLLTQHTVCNFIAFISSGCVRHFHIKDGVERTCDISFENTWVTDFQSFNNNTACIMNLQAMEATTVFLIRKPDLLQLYNINKNYESFGRLMAEKVAQRATEIAMSLSANKPEERFTDLIQKQTDIFQRIPQKYIANFLGISAESLSRIRKRILQKQKS